MGLLFELMLQPLIAYKLHLQIRQVLDLWCGLLHHWYGSGWSNELQRWNTHTFACYTHTTSLLSH